MLQPGGEQDRGGGLQGGEEFKLGGSGTFPYTLWGLWGGGFGLGQELIRDDGLPL